MADDVDLDEIAEWTEFYSGADLQALVYSAQLEAIHSVIDLSDYTGIYIYQNAIFFFTVPDIILMISPFIQQTKDTPKADLNADNMTVIRLSSSDQASLPPLSKTETRQIAQEVHGLLENLKLNNKQKAQTEEASQVMNVYHVKHTLLFYIPLITSINE